MSGFYLMHRGWRGNPAFQDDPCSEREAWVWLIEEAAYQDRRVRIGKVVLDVKRGQVAVSTRFLSEAWKWSHSKVRRFLDRLEKEAMIGTETDTGVTVITLCNYERYQSVDYASGTDEGTAPARNRHSSGTKQKEGNEIKEGKESRALPGDALPDLAEQGVVGSPVNDNAAQPAKQAKRGTRVPDGDLPDEWASAANHTREKHQLPLLTKRVLGLRWENFRNYWGGLAGSKGLKADWRKTWLNDCISPVTERKFPAGQPPPANGNAPQQPKRQASSLSDIPLFFDTPTEV
ncbi:hypothetical protein [Azospirillum rugosum]|uniref:Uncharacterized protein n=1 Tax=Azospirillum rugosum TaxID=416170 RepID=A0ABS4SDT5_9PROT|nr:hypothetical protein [Azospirillum rugosum]MBP2290743.1 hypothetical protein [Azospirillum rugosum]MDQ0525632.1 hypothetical protein [Azospirillum rugosum]